MKRRKKAKCKTREVHYHMRQSTINKLKRIAKSWGYDTGPEDGYGWLGEMLYAGSQELYDVWWRCEQKVKQQLAKPAKAPKPRPIDLLLARLKDPATAEQTAHDMLVRMGVRKPVLKLVKAG